jgi:predicted RNA binding protein YcfA (HicA-like mRNA interferase family)
VARCLPYAASRLNNLGGERHVAKKVHEVISILEAHGWQQLRERGSHRQFRHPTLPAVVTVTGKRSDTMPVGQLTSIRRKSGIEDLR